MLVHLRNIEITSNERWSRFHWFQCNHVFLFLFIFFRKDTKWTDRCADSRSQSIFIHNLRNYWSHAHSHILWSKFGASRLVDPPPFPFSNALNLIFKVIPFGVVEVTTGSVTLTTKPVFFSSLLWSSWMKQKLVYELNFLDALEKFTFFIKNDRCRVPGGVFDAINSICLLQNCDDVCIT